ncbi:MAG: type II secretion system protein [Actinophytocola sp.]|nr:type II secretion system protein [Actinophytocola sp.]
MIALALGVLAVAVLVLPAPRASALRTQALLSARRAPDGPRSDSGGRPGASPRIRRARRDDSCGLAAHWDLLAACLRAGMPVADALGALADSMPTSATPGSSRTSAAAALRRTGELIALGAAPEDAWRPALDCAATAPLARAARRTARSGSALAGAAADLAARTRAEAAELAQERAQRAGVLITLPLGLCFLPAFLLLGVVPVVIGLASTLTIAS